jgi:hypothetical protein
VVVDLLVISGSRIWQLMYTNRLNPVCVVLLQRVRASAAIVIVAETGQYSRLDSANWHCQDFLTLAFSFSLP